VGYYFFSWPLITSALGILSGVLMITLLMLAALYWVRGELVLPPRRASIERSPAIHMGSLLVAYFVLLAVRLIVADVPQLLWSTTGPLVGASYADVNAMIPGYWISAVAALAGAALIAYGIARNKLIWYTAIAVLAYVAVGLLARGAYPFAVQRLVVAPNELSSETPFLQRHITATRHAWGLACGGNARPHGRGDADAREHPRQLADHRERAVVGTPPAATDVRAAAGDQDVLRFRAS
jgi:uncharacterized protein